MAEVKGLDANPWRWTLVGEHTGRGREGDSESGTPQTVLYIGITCWFCSNADFDSGLELSLRFFTSSELSGAVAGLRISLCIVGGVRIKKLP